MYDLIINGTIISMDNQDSIYSWIYIESGLIKDCGNYEGYKRYLHKSDNVLDLKGKTVMPGFIDSHVYMIQTGLNMMAVDLSEARCIDDVFELLIKRRDATPRGQLIRGVKFDDFNVIEKRFPTRQELDRLFPDHPVWINRIELHTSVVNSYALSNLKIPFNLQGLEVDNDVITGIVNDRANAFVRNAFYNKMTDKMRFDALNLAVDYAKSKGITTVNAIEAGFAFSDKDGDYVIKQIDKMAIDIVLFYQSLDLDKMIEMGLSRVGCIFLDGSIGSKTAAISLPYINESNNCGSLYYTEKHLKSFVLEAHKLDFQIAIHAVGDRAIDLALDAYENALRYYPKTNHRHRIEHFELPSTRAIRRMSESDIIASMVLNAGEKWSGEGEAYVENLGSDRMSKSNPFSDILQMGVTVAAGSDSDITEMNPFSGIHQVVNTCNMKRKTSLKEALSMYTINGAIACNEEHIKGTVEKYKYADLIVLDQNPYEIEVTHLKDIKVLKTLKKGSICYEKEVSDG